MTFHLGPRDVPQMMRLARSPRYHATMFLPTTFHPDILGSRFPVSSPPSRRLFRSFHSFSCSICIFVLFCRSVHMHLYVLPLRKDSSSYTCFSSVIVIVVSR